MTIDSADDSKISNRTINTNRISNRTYDSKSNWITKLCRSLPYMNCKFVGPYKTRLGSMLLKQYCDFAAKQTNTGIARSACEIARL